MAPAPEEAAGVGTKRMHAALKKFLDLVTLSKAERRHRLVGPPKLWKMKRDFQIQFLTANGLRPEHYLLDLGCGTLRGGIPLIAYLQEGHYYGIEPRAEVLEQGRRELREAGLEGKRPVLGVGAAVADHRLPRRFDYVWAFSVLIHMSDEMLGAALAFARAHLEADGRFYANVNIGDTADQQWQGFPLVWRSRAFYDEACRRAGLVAQDVGSLRELEHVTDVGIMDDQRMLRIVHQGGPRS